jgi:hypothetical protein
MVLKQSDLYLVPGRKWWRIEPHWECRPRSTDTTRPEARKARQRSAP